MLKDLFVNATILISFLFVGSQAFKNNNLIVSKPKGEILVGISNGLLAIILMIFSIHITSVTLLDLRHIALIISALYGGFLSSIITGFIIFVFRSLFLGLNITGIIAATGFLMAAVVCGFIGNSKLHRHKKYLFMNISSIFIVSCVYVIVLRDVYFLEKVLLFFIVSSLITGYLVYYVSGYIETSLKVFKRLKDESTKDFLTGLNNVRKFDTLINAAMKTSILKNEKLSFLMIDIDFFKRINDTHGHAAGDAVLKELGNVLCDNCRSFDEISRNGGEEFSAILPDCSKEQALLIAERLRSAVENHAFTLPDNKKINITISIGVSTYPDTIQDIELIIKEADYALYRAKQSGRNRVC